MKERMQFYMTHIGYWVWSGDRYLTVMDITSELQSLESRDLDTLRKKMVFVGAEEK